MHEQSFQDVGMSSKMDPSHPARLAHVRERPLQHLPATPQEPTAPLPADPAPVGIHGVASRLLLLPAPASPERWTPSFGQVFVTVKVESGFMIQAAFGWPEVGRSPRLGQLRRECTPLLASDR